MSKPTNDAIKDKSIAYVLNFEAFFIQTFNVLISTPFTKQYIIPKYVKHIMQMALQNNVAEC